VAEGRIRFALGLTIIGAAALIAGLTMILVGETLRLKSAHSQGLVAGGEIAAICGLASGVALLVVVIVGPADRPLRRRGPGPAEQAWTPPGYVHEGWHARSDQEADQWPQERWDPTASQHWDHQAGPGWQPEAEGQWSPAAAEGWRAAAADDWDRGQAGDGGPDEHGDWGPGRYDSGTPDGHDGWDREAWAHDGGGSWVAGGTDGWIPPGQVPGGQPDWAEPVRNEWAPGDHGALIPDGRGGWAQPPRNDWDRATPAAPYLGDTADRQAPGPAYGHAGDPAYGHVAGPAYGNGGDPAYGHVAGPAHGHLAGAADGDADARLPAPGAAVQDNGADDDRAADDTSPIPVILAAEVPGLPPRSPQPNAAPKPFSVWEPARPRAQPPDELYRPEHAEPPSADTQEKIEQIKDLYMTAEAIGEDALVRHFDQLKKRQRSLIREFFEKAGLGPGVSANPSQDAPGESAADGASLPS
jgi:hypothetical protein